MKKILIAALLMLFGNTLSAQFKIDLELRPRFEMRNGYQSLPDSSSRPAWGVSQRSRLSMNYIKDRLEVHFAMQDSRIWGDEDLYTSTGVAGKKASIDLYQAWAKYAIRDFLSIKMGRQRLSYGDQRLVSERNWNQTGVTYDALLLAYNRKFQADLVLGYNNNANSLFAQEYYTNRIRSFNFLYLSSPWKKDMRLNSIIMATGYQDYNAVDRMNFKYTYGLMLEKKGKLAGTISAYYQHGQDTARKEISAWMFNILAGYKSTRWELMAGYDRISGQDNMNQDAGYQEKSHLFDIFYGMRHSNYGYMDLFSNIPKSTANAGLQDIFLKYQKNWENASEFQFFIHYFMLENRLAVKNVEQDPGLGYEVDLRYRYKLYEFVTMEAGYGIFLPEETMQNIQKTGDPDKLAHWLYVMFTIKPELFNSAKK